MEQFLYAVPLLACPLGMGLMMWLMSRKGHGHDAAQPDTAADLARLRAELSELGAAQAARAGETTTEARPQ